MARPDQEKCCLCSKLRAAEAQQRHGPTGVTKDAPLHALGAELWVRNNLTAKIESIHCLGLTEQQIKTLLIRILDVFSQHSGMKVERFRSAVELHLHNCPIHPCPLYPEGTL